MTRRLHNALATAFRSSGEPSMSIDELLKSCAEEHPEAYDATRPQLANALSARGMTLVNGIVRLTANEQEPDNGPAGWADFKRAARRAMQWRSEPMAAMDIIAETGLTEAQVPYAHMESVLASIGMHFIPGHGYWKFAIYSDGFSRIVETADTPRRIGPVIDMLRQYGWPLAGKDIERWSKGKVTAVAVSQEAYRGNIYIRPIGRGLYVPADQKGDLPLSANVADRLLRLLDDDWLTTDDVRIYRLACVLGASGMATVRHARQTHSGRKLQAVSFTPNRKGMAVLLRAARRPAEVF